MNVLTVRRLPPAARLLLWCGIGAAFVYVVTDLVAAAIYPRFSLSDQAVSELFAIGAPTSSLVVPLFSLSSALLLAFATGMAFSQQTWALRLMALMFAGSGIVGLLLWNFFPMHMRGDARTFTDTMHLILATNPFVLATLAIGAVAFRNWFRWASIAAIIAVVAPAVLAFHYAAALNLGQPTPGLGLTERTAQYAYQVWQITLALLLLRGSSPQQRIRDPPMEKTMIGKVARVLSLGAMAAGAATYLRYRKDMATSRAKLARGSTIAETAAGQIEFAERGNGPALLMVHGAGGGYDQGLLLAEEIGDGFRVIAPSRFGYLRTPVPKDSSPAAQADAHAALMDFVGVEKAIVAGASAGAPSAIELALRHPDRVSALILLVPRTYHPTQSIGADESAESQTVLRLVEASADFLFWLAARVSRRSVVRFLGVPPDVEAKASEEERGRVTRIIDSILPLSSRVRGIATDGEADIHAWPLEQISCPVLIISAEDDLYKTPPGARFTAAHIPGAELHVFKSGGHLMVGHTAKLRNLVRNSLQHHHSSRSKQNPTAAVDAV